MYSTVLNLGCTHFCVALGQIPCDGGMQWNLFGDLASLHGASFLCTHMLLKVSSEAPTGMGCLQASQHLWTRAVCCPPAALWEGAPIAQVESQLAV